MCCLHLQGHLQPPATLRLAPAAVALQLTLVLNLVCCLAPCCLHLQLQPPGGQTACQDEPFSPCKVKKATSAAGAGHKGAGASTTDIGRSASPRLLQSKKLVLLPWEGFCAPGLSRRPALLWAALFDCKMTQGVSELQMSDWCGKMRASLLFAGA